MINFLAPADATLPSIKIAIASDHGGFKLKSVIINNFLSLKTNGANEANGIIKKTAVICDFGPDNDLKSVDYPDYAQVLVKAMVTEAASAKSIAKPITKPIDFGILICKTGIGMSIAANRNQYIRAALCLNVRMAKQARLHNDANILVLGSDLVQDKLALAIVNEFLTTEFAGGRHIQRIAKLSLNID